MKTIIITGASGSVGEAASRIMAQEGWHVIMACRNMEKGKVVKERIEKELSNSPSFKGGSGRVLELQEVEMSSPNSIHAFANRLEGRKIDALFNNAGIMCRHFSRTDEGIERTMAVNYLGTALLTDLILPLMPVGGNIVNMVSLTTRFARLDENWRQWDEHHFGQLSTYGSSKLAVLYHSIALARRHPELHINVSDPGIVNSNMISMDRWYDSLADIFFRPFIKTPEQGARSAINAIHSTESLRYYVGNKSKPIAPRYLNSPLVEQLWMQLNTKP